jgi:hypothetical protein
VGDAKSTVAPLGLTGLVDREVLMEGIKERKSGGHLVEAKKQTPTGWKTLEK